MNPVFIFLILVAAVLLWFLVSFIFIPVGGMIIKRMKKIEDIINYEEDKKTNESKENE